VMLRVGGCGCVCVMVRAEGCGCACDVANGGLWVCVFDVTFCKICVCECVTLHYVERHGRGFFECCMSHVTHMYRSRNTYSF